jgi:hypothetical protein
MPPKHINTDDGPSRASHSRESSSGSARHAHAPATPSQLRQAHAPSDRSSSPEEVMHRQRYYDEEPQPSSSEAPYDLEFSTDGMQPALDGASVHSNHEDVPNPQGGIIEIDLEPTVRTRLLAQQNWDTLEGTQGRPGVHRNYGSFAGSIHSENSFGGAFPGPDSPEGDSARSLLGDAVADGVMGSGNGKKKSTTKWLAERHGVKNQRMMYVELAL